MKHKELQLLVSSYVDGEVVESDRAKIMTHLEICTECREFVTQAKRLREEIQALGEAELSSTFTMRTVSSVEKHSAQEGGWLGIEPLARNTFLTIAIVVLIMFLLTNYDTSASSSSVDRLVNEITSDTTATQVLLQLGEFSKNDLLFAVMTQ